ncbi:MAG: hypothetical protein LBI42_08050 [Chitinispirillales bacterium]|jgi:hypothetical protein|nr:hypothetical protein [Chitinispirillales bacterium]
MMVEVLLAAVVILQIITITLIRGNKKHKRNNYEFRHSRPSGSENKTERKENDFRRSGGNNRKFQPESRNNRQQTPSSQQHGSQVTIDPVEKSLRDINLKLKNAEREQENARKKIQGDYPAKDSRHGQRPAERSGNNGNKRNKGEHRRDFNREGRRDNWQEKHNRGDSEIPAAAPESENIKQLQQLEPGQPAQQFAVQEPINVIGSTDTILDDKTISEGELEHGRKFIAKRRQLHENGSESFETNSVSAGEGNQEQEAAPQSEEGAEIKFGRR